MATDWGGSGKGNGGNKDGNGSSGCPIVLVGVIAAIVLLKKLVRKSR
jgi:hypothetical protein